MCKVKQELKILAAAAVAVAYSMIEAAAVAVLSASFWSYLKETDHTHP
jgi:hypothetical protein